MRKYFLLLIPLLAILLFGCSNGVSGATWHTGSGAPASELGNDGDLYFEESAADVYLKADSAWSVIANLKGLTGATGATWIVGSGDPSGPPEASGAVGDFYFDSTSAELKVYVRDVDGWQFVTGLKGLQGIQGLQGADGATWWTGSGIPTGIGKDGDLYLRTGTGDIYKNTSGTWSPTGANLTGPRGATWFTGTNLETDKTNGSLALSADGDFYLETLTAKIYKKIGGAWVFQGILTASTDGGVSIGTVTPPVLADIPILLDLPEFTNPEGTGYSNAVPIEITVSGSPSDFSGYFWYLDGRKLDVEPTSSSISLSNLEMGTHNICLRVLKGGIAYSSHIFSFLVTYEGGLE